MPEQDLNDPDIGVRFQEMRGEAVPQRVQRCGFADPGHVFGRGEGAVELPRRDRVDPGFAGKQPALRPRLAPVGAQELQQPGRQHDLAVLLPLALFDMDQHPVTVDVADLEVTDL